MRSKAATFSIVFAIELAIVGHFGWTEGIVVSAIALVGSVAAFVGTFLPWERWNASSDAYLKEELERQAKHDHR